MQGLAETLRGPLSIVVNIFFLNIFFLYKETAVRHYQLLTLSRGLTADYCVLQGKEQII